MANALDISKALSTQISTTGDVLVPELIQAGIREYFERRTPVWNQFRKVPVDSNAVVYKEQTSVPVASFGAELGSLPAVQSSAFLERAIPLKSIYTRGEVSGQLIAAARSVLDVLQLEVRNHTIGMINTLETTLVLGDATARPNEFDGLNTWITNEVFATSDGTGAGTDEPLVLGHLEQLLDAPRYSDINLLFMNDVTRRRLWSVLQPQIRFLGNTEIDGGFKVRAYNDLPIVEVKPNSVATGADLANIILAVNTEMIWLPVLQDLTYEELAHTRDSTDFIIKMYLGMIVEGGEHYHAKLTNFTTAVE
jgi:hypothetical protein